MSMARWRPFNELLTWQRAMDRLFNEAMTQPGRWWDMEELSTIFPIDVYQTDKDVVIKASLPGAKPEDVEITVSGDTVTIKGEIKTESEVKKENYLYQEGRYGSFYREINLPVPVAMDKADAKFEDGMLIVTLPKSEQAKPKQIKVKAKPVLEGQTGKPSQQPKK